MKMWSMKVIILLLFCYARPLTGKVYFDSKNFKNVLHWEPDESASPEEKVLYSVQYKSDDMDQFQIKKECHNITALSCDLTEETVSVYDIQYEAWVLVNGRHYGKTTRFKPIAETTFGPPSLSIYTTVSSLHVDVTLPEGPNGISIADIINRSTNGHSQNIIIYTLGITEPKWAALVNRTKSSHFVISLNSNQQKYCGYVFYKTLSEWGRPESQNASFCAILQGDHSRLLPWFLISAVLLAAIIAMLVVFMCNYVKSGKQKGMPHSLVSFPTQHKILQSPDEKLSVNKAHVCTTKTVYATILVKPQMSSIGNGGYSPQDIILQACTGSSVGTNEDRQILDPLDTSAQSSDIYGAVVVHVPDGKNEDVQQATTNDQKYNNPSLSFSRETWDKGGIGSPTLVTVHNLDSTTKPLMLHTVRNPNGQLTLSSLEFEFQSDTGNEVSLLSFERKPLLCDLTDIKTEGPSLDTSDWSDSGCDDSTINTPTIYSPSQANFHQECLNSPSCDITFESGYKQNWMSEMLLGTAVKDNCY